jgi:hypothetical protein
MFSDGDNGDFLVLLFFLSTLTNNDDPEYADRLYRIIRRRLPRLRSGDKELDLLFQELIEFRAFSGSSYRRRTEEARETAQSVVEGFRKGFEDSIFGRFQAIEGQVRAIEQTQERLISDSEGRNEQFEISKAEIQSYFWILSTGADLANIQLKRYVPARVYISDPVPSTGELYNLIEALDDLTSFVGFEKAGEFPSESGSWWKQIFYRTKDAVSQQDVQKRLAKAEQAVQTIYLDKPQAEANAQQAEAFSKIVGVLKEVPDACIQVGSLLLVKTTDASGKSMVMARTLTVQELPLLR